MREAAERLTARFPAATRRFWATFMRPAIDPAVVDDVESIARHTAWAPVITEALAACDAAGRHQRLVGTGRENEASITLLAAFEGDVLKLSMFPNVPSLRLGAEANVTEPVAARSRRCGAGVRISSSMDAPGHPHALPLPVDLFICLWQSETIAVPVALNSMAKEHDMKRRDSVPNAVVAVLLVAVTAFLPTVALSAQESWQAFTAEGTFGPVDIYNSTVTPADNWTITDTLLTLEDRGYYGAVRGDYSYILDGLVVSTHGNGEPDAVFEMSVTGGISDWVADFWGLRWGITEERYFAFTINAEPRATHAQWNLSYFAPTQAGTYAYAVSDIIIKGGINTLKVRKDSIGWHFYINGVEIIEAGNYAGSFMPGSDGYIGLGNKSGTYDTTPRTVTFQDFKVTYTTASDGGIHTMGKFVRGDSNDSSSSGRKGDPVDIGDAIYTLTYLFAKGPAPHCLDSADTNDDGQIDIGDAIYTLNFLFGGQGVKIPPPYPNPGYDPARGIPDNEASQRSDPLCLE